MNKKFADLVINHIKRKQSISESDERICRYTLEGLFSFFIKTIFIILISIFLNLLYETLLLILIYGILRTLSFGLHATKDVYCWISSIIIYLLIPYLIKITTFSINVYYILFMIGSTLMIYYSPADTPKRPLIRINKNKRNQMILSFIVIFLLIISILIDNKLLDNTIIYSILLQSFCVNPLVYKLFNIRYNNYLYYKKTTV